jgi:hypothetical protein
MAGMTHVVVRIIEMAICVGLAASVIIMFSLLLIAIVHGLHEARRHYG